MKTARAVSVSTESKVDWAESTRVAESFEKDPVLVAALKAEA